MKQFTYSGLKKPEQRQEMLFESISSIGTKSGNYGEFNEQAKMVTMFGANKIKSEIDELKRMYALDEDLLACMPTLKKLIE